MNIALRTRLIAGMFFFCLVALLCGCSENDGRGQDWLSSVRPDHPRLFLNRDILPDIRKYTLEREADFYGRFKARVDERIEDDLTEGDYGSQAAEAAFVYLIEQDPKYMVRSRDLLRKSLEFYHARFAEKQSVSWYAFSRVSAWAALDWIWNDLSEQERTELAASFLVAVKNVMPISSWRGDREAFERENWSGPESGFYGTLSLSWYAGLVTLGEGIDDTLALRLTRQGYSLYNELLSYRGRMAGDDGGSASAALNYALAAYPWAEFNFFHTFESATGINPASRWSYPGNLPGYVFWNLLPGDRTFGWGDSYHENPRVGLGQMHMHLAQTIHFYGDGLPREMAFTRWFMDRLERVDRISFPFARFLVYRDHPELQPLGPDRVLPHARHFENMGQVFFRSGSGDSDTYATFTSGGELEQHKHFDHNNFNIFRKGFLALDTGTRPEPGQHLSHYYSRTVAHNCILIRMPGEAMPRYWGNPAPGEEPLAYPNDGGQRSAVRGSQVVAFETWPEYSYVAGDATGAYSPEKCSLALRQFVFLNPDYFVIFDRVTSTDGIFPKTWLFHTAHEPSIEGTVFRAEHEQGRVFCRTLLPEDAVVGKIGGPGRQFWADGRNWPLPEGYRTPDTTALLGQWRVEVTPGALRQDDHFLHLIHVGDRDSLRTMAQSELVREDGMVGVRFSRDGDAWRVLFAVEGPAAGRVEIRRDGEVVLDRPLTNSVAPQSGLFGTSGSSSREGL